ncbi:hypothetical protein [Mycolicibacterium goodii]|uniref:hypothetical protein n=1 Tax=Mycolicibacterium goodii TaxID=134601 RepID=UPI001BDC04F1|nr:hypothetical protein [Mycolicibacterium goodii]MBU8841578.1 hypothetical protein [Mycolicibacterium goodii]
MASTNAHGLLSEQEVAAQSGLAVELVSSLIPASEVAAEGVAVYDEIGLWRAKVAKLLLDRNVRMNLVKAAVHEPLTCDQLRATVEGITSGAQTPSE